MMSAAVTIELRKGYVHMQLPEHFIATRKSVGAIWRQLVDACRAHETSCVLCEGAVAGRRMSRMDVFDVGDALARKIPGLTLALLFHDYEFTDNSRFFQDVAYNRGVKVRFFAEKLVALEWLESNP